MKPQFYPQKINLNIGRFFVDKKNLTIRLLAIIFISLLTVSMNAQTIGTVTVVGAPACQGSTVTLSFLVTNGSGSSTYFTTNTTYIIYYNGGAGFGQLLAFKSATAPSGDGGSATITESITVPSSAPAGTNYKVSAGSVSPTFNGSAGANASAAFTIHAGPSSTYTKYYASSCVGGDGTITVTGNGGTPGYLYSIDNGSFTSNSHFTGLAAGEHKIVVQDANLCTFTYQGITVLT